VRGIDGEATLTKSNNSAQIVWGGDPDAALPHLKAGTTLTFTYEAKSGAAGTLTPYPGTRNESNVLVSSAGVDVAAVGPNWTTITRTCTLERFADTMWLTAGATIPNGTEINVRNLRVTLDGSTDHAPYSEAVQPIPLDGHELRSLPDGTRDELTVDERGHAVLVQRVGHVVLDGSESSWEQKGTNTSGKYSYTFPCGLPDGSSLAFDAVSNWTLCDRFPNASDAGLNNGTYTCHTGVSARRTASGQAIFYHTGESLADWKTWLASNPTALDYKLATPVTHDLGYVAAVPLCGPDLTAQAIPSAPFALTYERDLNATLARLESAIATLA
jgi:hypothetical protein